MLKLQQTYITNDKYCNYRTGKTTLIMKLFNSS